MKKLLLHETDDGKNYLYLADSAKPELTLITVSSDPIEYKAPQYLLAKETNTLYFIWQGEFFSFVLPENLSEQISFSGQNLISCDSITDLWHALVFNKDLKKWELQKLGFRKEIQPLDHKSKEEYFLLNNETGNRWEISYFVGNTVYFAGDFLSVPQQCMDRFLLAKRYEDFYDLYRIGCPYQISRCIFGKSAFNHLNNMYKWDDEIQAWKKFEEMQVLGENASLTTCGDRVILREFKDAEIVREIYGKGYYRKQNNDFDYVCVDGVKYFLGATDFVNFQDPKYKFWKRVKIFFKDLKNIFSN